MKGRRMKIAIAALVVLAALLGLNALVTGKETKDAEVTVQGGRIVELPGGDLQVVDRGPRQAPPIVLIHCFTCAIDWWDRVMPRLERRHRVIAFDLLGHGGSGKPDSGYSMENQAGLVAEALERLGVREATVVGHSLGGIVATALSEAAPELVDGVVIVDEAPENDGYGADLPLAAKLTFTPVIGEALWRATPDFAIRDGLGVAFAPDFDVPDEFIDDFHRLTYTSYDESPQAEDAYTDAEPLDRRIDRSGLPLLAIFGSEEQIYNPEEALAAYAAVPGAETRLVRGAGHSPNVERPAITASLVLRFADSTVRDGKWKAGKTAPQSEKGRPNGRPR
jgi:pimeloyl-ACP methyl ester carboxylesterase